MSTKRTFLTFYYFMMYLLLRSHDFEQPLGLKKFSPACDAFDLYKGSLHANTKLIFLGEFHSERNKTIACIEELTKHAKAHTLLLEGYRANVDFPCDTAFFHTLPNRKCVGWEPVVNDTLVIHSSFSRDFSKIIIKTLKTHLQNSEYAGFSSEEHYMVLKAIAERVKSTQFTGMFKPIIDSIWEIHQTSKVPYQFLIALSIYKLEETYSVGTDHDFLKNNCRIRNNGLVEILKYQNELQVVIAGMAHLTPRKVYMDISDPDQCASNVVNDYLEKEKSEDEYAVLIMK